MLEIARPGLRAVTAGPEDFQLAATLMLALRLRDIGVECSMLFPVTSAPIVRVDAMNMIETTALSDGRYEVWRVDTPSDPAPLYYEQSLDQVVALLSQSGSRA